MVSSLLLALQQCFLFPSNEHKASCVHEIRNNVFVKYFIGPVSLIVLSRITCLAMKISIIYLEGLKSLHNGNACNPYQILVLIIENYYIF
jgi:hypothetical protein